MSERSLADLSNPYADVLNTPIIEEIDRVCRYSHQSTIARLITLQAIRSCIDRGLLRVVGPEE